MRFFHSLTFRGYQSVAKPTNCVLSAKIIVLREKNGTTQEKPAIADNRCACCTTTQK